MAVQPLAAFDRAKQRAEALDRANNVRKERARIRKEVAGGVLDPVSLLDDLPETCSRVQVGEFLTWIPQIGKERARRILQSVEGLPVSETIPLKRLVPRQRNQLQERLRLR